MKNTGTVLKEDRAFLSPHIGDLENLKAFEFFKDTIGTMEAVLECNAEVVAHDMHPGYFSTQWVRGNTSKGETIPPVQHHRAHMAAVMAEHGLQGKTLGVIMDGTGYGSDETIWGGEILAGDFSSFTREGHLQVVPLPGGDSAIKAPWKTAASYLRMTLGNNPDLWPELDIFSGRPLLQVLEMVDKGLNSPLTSSCGRLFDAVAALTGQWSEVKYEAQAAIEFMARTDAVQVADSAGLPGVTTDSALADGVIQTAPLISGVLACIDQGLGVDKISAGFHRSLIDLLCASVSEISDHTKIRQVVLGGGVFQNHILLDGLANSLLAQGLDVYTPCALPPNDGGIAFGQAAIARALFNFHDYTSP